MQPAGMLRRVLAIVVDFLVFYVVTVTVGIVLLNLDHPEYGYVGLVVYFVAIHLPLTRCLGCPRDGQSPASASFGWQTVGRRAGVGPHCGLLSSSRRG